MNQEILHLEPRSVWRNFANLNAVPRPSKKEQKAVAFMQAFGQRLGLDTRMDETGNVIIRKPATPGMEDRVSIVLQGHLDMVHQMNAGTEFDFASEGIRMRIDGDWVMAEGTTLGADNGIGVAYIMAILESEDIPHPAIEALFTVDEESGMTGALGLSGDALSGSILLNLDTEDDTELTIGCAGAINVLASGSYAPEPSRSGNPAFVLGVKGLVGGHSGMDIHRGRANANKLLNRVLFLATEELGLRIGSIDAGGLRNAIPREAQARISVDTKQVGALGRSPERIRRQADGHSALRICCNRPRPGALPRACGFPDLAAADRFPEAVAERHLHVPQWRFPPEPRHRRPGADFRQHGQVAGSGWQIRGQLPGTQRRGQRKDGPGEIHPLRLRTGRGKHRIQWLLPGLDAPPRSADRQADERVV